MNQTNIGEHVRPLSELDSYKIEHGDLDPRGWSVVGPNGHRIGKVVDLLVDTTAMKVRQLIIDLHGDGGGGTASTVALDVSEVDLRNDTREVFATHYSDSGFATASSARPYAADAAAKRDETTLTRSEEELQVGKREVNRGEVRIGKHVETEHVSTPVTRRREEVVVERRPVQAGARADASLADDEIRIPLMEEELVVEKRAVVKEELVVGKRVVEERDVVEADVRREEFDIDRNVDIKSGEEFTRNRRG